MSEETRIDTIVSAMTEAEKHTLLFHLLLKRHSDGLNGRTWDASEHLLHETAVAHEFAKVLTRIDQLTEPTLMDRIANEYHAKRPGCPCRRCQS